MYFRHFILTLHTFSGFTRPSGTIADDIQKQLHIINIYKGNQTIKIDNKTMTKAEIVAEISKMTGVEREKSLKVVEAMMVIIKDKTAGGEDIFLRGFGTFTTKERAAKVGRLIKENKSVIVPAHKIPFFKPCEDYKDMF